MRMGLDVWMVTGDNRRVAAALATRVGIDHSRVMAEVLPADKARKVRVETDKINAGDEVRLPKVTHDAASTAVGI